MDNERIDIPKTAFDKEYSTQWRREVKFLEAKGINYVYAKKHMKYPIIKYKYTKTPELFLALTEFYNQVRIEKLFKDIEKVTEKVNEVKNEKMPIEEGCMKVNESDLTEYEKDLVSFQTEELINVINGEYKTNNVNDDTE